jgi:hypothetical protein
VVVVIRATEVESRTGVVSIVVVVIIRIIRCHGKVDIPGQFVIHRTGRVDGRRQRLVGRRAVRILAIDAGLDDDGDGPPSASRVSPAQDAGRFGHPRQQQRAGGRDLALAPDQVERVVLGDAVRRVLEGAGRSRRVEVIQHG